MATDEVVRLDLCQCGISSCTLFLGILAARVKGAARRRIDRAGHIAFEDDALHVDVRIGRRHSRDQRLCVRDAWGYAAVRLGFGDLNQTAHVHDRNAVADVFNHRKIMRDEDEGQAQFLAQARRAG